MKSKSPKMGSTFLVTINKFWKRNTSSKQPKRSILLKKQKKDNSTMMRNMLSVMRDKFQKTERTRVIGKGHGEIKIHFILQLELCFVLSRRKKIKNYLYEYNIILSFKKNYKKNLTLNHLNQLNNQFYWFMASSIINLMID